MIDVPKNTRKAVRFLYEPIPVGPSKTTLATSRGLALFAPDGAYVPSPYAAGNNLNKAVSGDRYSFVGVIVCNIPIIAVRNLLSATGYNLT